MIGISGRYRSRRPRLALTVVLGALLAGGLLLAPAPGPAPAQAQAVTTCPDPVVSMGTATVTYSHTGGAQTWLVPAGVTQATFDVQGAQGGDLVADDAYPYVPLSFPGGWGGCAVATLSVTPGDTVYLFVGGAGGIGFAVDATSNCTPGPPSSTNDPCPYGGSPGGFNGGGSGNGGVCAGALIFCIGGGGGGGASDVRVGGTDPSNRVLVAGGGGGATYDATGGSGGGLTGGTGGGDYQGGTGGNQDGTSGSGLPGGVGSAAAENSGGGGGGGGYWGGAAPPAYGAGGGGSGFEPLGSPSPAGPGPATGRSSLPTSTRIRPSPPRQHPRRR